MDKPHNADRFAEMFKLDVDASLRMYEENPATTMVGILLGNANLSDDQRSLVSEALRTALYDTIYTALLALDGAASLDGVQQPYSILDEDGNSVFSSGDLEVAAYEHFHEDASDDA